MCTLLCGSVTASDYQKELDALDQALKKATELNDEPALQRLRVIHWRYRRATLVGDVNELHKLSTEIAEVMSSENRSNSESVVPAPVLQELVNLQIKVLLKLHRLVEAETILNAQPLSDRVSLEAELALQKEDLAAAGAKVNRAVEAKSSWDNLARLAHYHAMMGRRDEADTVYEQAQDQLTVKEMRFYAWLELQRGRLDFVAGRFDEAEAHYRTASDSYSGYWQIEEAIAELMAARGKFDEAANLYQKVLVMNARPETLFALGLLDKQRGRLESSKQYFDRAHREFLASAKRGESHYLHHLVDYYCDIQNEGEQALKWARSDFELRPNAHTRQALAWAFFLTGEEEPALLHIDKSLSSGLQDPHLFQRASRIYSAVGMKPQANTMRERSFTLAPQQDLFHLHY